MLRATWIRQGKRLRRRAFGSLKFALYDQVFHYKYKTVLTDKFIKEAGLDNPDTFDVVCETLRTDYGLHVLGKLDVPAKKKGKIKSVMGRAMVNAQGEQGKVDKKGD
jgi:hypothetical protein